MKRWTGFAVFAVLALAVLAWGLWRLADHGRFKRAFVDAARAGDEGAVARLVSPAVLEAVAKGGPTADAMAALRASHGDRSECATQGDDSGDEVLVLETVPPRSIYLQYHRADGAWRVEVLTTEVPKDGCITGD